MKIGYLILALLCGPVFAQQINCGAIYPPAQPTSAVPVRTYGAIPGDGVDDTAALQRALDAGGALAFEAGQYLTTAALYSRKSGTALYGNGAIIHATNPDGMAIIVQGDNTGVYNLRFTAVTSGRRSAPWHTRIAVYREVAGVVQPVLNTSIIGNVIAPPPGAGAPINNSASTGGIMLQRAVGFLVAGNRVERTLADGIHITAGSRDGAVIGNTVRENGDDMIAVVSYAGSGKAALGSAAELRSDWPTRVDQRLVRNVLIARNDLAGNYWGRGITVAGGQDVTIDGNKIDNVPIGAGIMVAREAGYATFGVRNVLARGNALSRIQTSRSAYDPDGTQSTRSRTGHGAIEVHSSLFDDESAEPYLRQDLAVREVAFVANTLSGGASIPAARVGVDSAGAVTAQRPDGSTASRNVVTGDVVGTSIGGVAAVTGSTFSCAP